MTRARLVCALLLPFACLIALSPPPPASRAEEDRPALPVVAKVEQQPLAAQAKRVADALEFLGAPLPAADRQALAAAAKAKDGAKAVQQIQATLDKHCLAAVNLRQIEDGLALTAQRGPAKPELAEQGWRTFLVKVLNPDGIDNRSLQAASPNAAPLHRRSTSRPDPKPEPASVVTTRFLDLISHDSQPLTRDLSGLAVEYRVVSVYCRDPGKKDATLRFRLPAVGKAQPVVSNELRFAFDAAPAVKVTLKVKDHNGQSKLDGRPVVASFLFRDAQGRVYPSQARRLAPDFFFHAQVYRADGETVLLQPGQYTVSWTRGPEYLVQSRPLKVLPGKAQTETFDLKRWIHPAKKGWWSGDHHIHAAGCAHYESPTEGVTPEDMMRHILGEDLNVGCCLSWGPCWYHQKRYFDGKTHKLSTANHLLRYDVEVSGFPSSHSGHICLLRLKEQDYPGTKRIEDWPSWDLPIFQWAKKQNGVVGFAHTGWGLDVGDTTELPNYTVPPMNGIGANEYLVDVAHDACDFLSTVDTPAIWELNIWYHTLNCGFRCRISGETDFPCIYGERVGIGRSYVHLGNEKPLDFDSWAEGIKQGRSYVTDGKSHLLDFTVGGLGVGLKGSELKLPEAGPVEVKATVAALLEPKPTPETERIRQAKWNHKPYWDIERARVGRSRKVPVEVIVNGLPVARTEIEADGKEHPVSFKVPLKHSSWVALRVLGSSHTNPVFVLVADKPIRASKKSAQWCLDGIDRCWQQKKRNIRKPDLAAAEKAYDQARAIYRKLLKECVAE